MRVDFLRQLAEAVIQENNPSGSVSHYQHKGKWQEPASKQAMDALEKMSYERLPEAHKNLFNAVTGVYLPGVDAGELLHWRFLAQTNLFFLCNLLEKYKDVSDKPYIWTDYTVHNTHEEICNEFFVSKDPTKTSFKQFALGYTDQKERLLLVPRGGFKSSIDMADTVQWIICWPEVTIMILTGILDLAKDFVNEIKGHFELEDSTNDINAWGAKKSLKPRTMADDTPSLFQVLFPEHCIPKEEGKQYEFQTPAAKAVDEACTVWASSIGQGLSGWHVGIMKLDDVVTNENSHTVARILEVNRQVSINNAMLHPYGFYDKIGTWYDSSDTYGQDIKYDKLCLTLGEPQKKKIYIRAAWWPNEAAVRAGKVESELLESDRIMWFPDEGQLTYAYLRGKMLEDAEGFAIKYLNDPSQVHRIKFPRELLLRHTIHSNLIPQQGMVVCTVDTAYSTKSWADYTVVITSLIYGGRFYIIDMKRGRYNEYELPQVIAANALQWKPKRICVEDSVGVKWLGKETYREMEKLNIRVPIEFISLGQGSKGKAKDQKAKPVLRLIGDDRLVFTNQCVGLEEIYNELSKFGTAEGLHDDIVSALSILVEQFASYAEMEGRQTQASPEYVADRIAKAEYDRIYGEGASAILHIQRSYARSLLEESGDDTPMQEQARAEDQQRTAQLDSDPLADLFG
jgi:phage terminase large subunit-like protein